MASFASVKLRTYVHQTQACSQGFCLHLKMS